MGGTFRRGRYDNNHWWERYTNDTLTELADRFNSSVDPEELEAATTEWLRQVNEQAVRVWLYIPNRGFAIAPRVTSYASYPYEHYIHAPQWNVAD